MNIALTNGRKPLGLLRRFLLLAGLFVTSVELAHSSEAPALIDRPNADSGPTQISVGIWVADISNIDSAQQNFTAEVAVVLRWKDSRLAHTGKGIVRYPLEQIWHPRVGIVNETNSVSRKMPDSVEVESDGTVTYRQRLCRSLHATVAIAIIPVRSANFSRPAGRGSVSVQRSNVRTGSGLDPRRA